MNKEFEIKSTGKDIVSLNKVGEIIFDKEQLESSIVKIEEYFDGLVFTEDQVKEAKNYKATLNGISKTLNAERIRIKKEFNKPLEEFEASVKISTAKIKKLTTYLTDSVSDFEDKIKEERKELTIEAVLKLEIESNVTGFFEYFMENNNITDAKFCGSTAFTSKKEPSKKLRETLNSILNEYKIELLEKEKQESEMIKLELEVNEYIKSILNEDVKEEHFLDFKTSIRSRTLEENILRAKNIMLEVKRLATNVRFFREEEAPVPYVREKIKGGRLVTEQEEPEPTPIKEPEPNSELVHVDQQFLFDCCISCKKYLTVECECGVNNKNHSRHWTIVCNKFENQ